ncbi:MAG TPA: hypothetical protein VK941_01265 [Gillisia sp.]|nr:hypothetical protein [Gillisia sp.]
MKNDILTNLNEPNPGQLESIYRTNKGKFRQEFQNLYPQIKGKPLADFWNERLNYESGEISWGTGRELLFVIIASLIAGFIAKIPQLAGIDPDYFYPRNIGFIVFPALTAYFVWKQHVQVKKLIFVIIAFVVSAIYINLLPGNDSSDTFILACIHLPLLLWAGLGYMFLGGEVDDNQKRLDFLRFNGDLIVITTLILIAGGLLTGVTLGLFELIGLKIQEFYFNYIAIWGAAAAPIVGAYLIQTNPQLVNKVSPVIAKVFTPLVLIMLITYLGAVIYTGKDPYNDREFLLIFNVLLIGVMAIILFSIAETFKKQSGKIGALTLLGLSVVTIIVNGIALSAIIFRISEMGITPNRLAVFGGNILILTNLLIVSYHQFWALKDNSKAVMVETSIATFLPVYIIWAFIVTFGFPFIFGFE